MAARMQLNRRLTAYAGAARVAAAISAPHSALGFEAWSARTCVRTTFGHKPGSPRTTSVSTP